MKKAMILMLIAVMLLVACQYKQAEQVDGEIPPAEDLPPAEGESPAEEPAMEPGDTPPPEDNAPEIDISQEDLDELEKELQGMEFEDLEAMS